MAKSGGDLSPLINKAGISSYKWWALAVICIGTFTSTMDNSIVNVAIPKLTEQFSVNETISVWVYLAYMLTVAGLTLTFGKIGDRIGRKRVYMIGMIITALGLGLNSLATSMPMLISFRVVQAVGAGMMIAVGPAIITNVFPDKERGKAMGFYVGSVGAGLAIGPALGGFLVDTFGWQSIFYMRLPIVLLVTAVAFRLLAEQKAQEAHHGFDKWGAVALFVGMFALLLGLNQSGGRGWTSLFVLGCLITAAVLIPLFIVIERKVRQPLLDLSLFRSRPFSMANLSLFISFLTRIAGIFLLSFFFQEGLGYSVFKSGMLQITIPIAMLVISPFTGLLSDTIGTRGLTTIGFTVLGVSLLLMSTLNETSHIGTIILILTILGVSIGLFESPNNSLIMGSVPTTKRGTASAMLSTSRGLGLTMGLAISSSIYALKKNLFISQGITKEAAVIDSFHYVTLIVAFVCIAGIIISFLAGNVKTKKA
ncbi:MAG: MFS transporter [Chloroflexi bacterium]|jgi:EmrB/QacA subfamily drug resistance transporter|nr:MFS transporter [Chloroflexota bacterium]MBT7080095.1 MFS transporter [Chloroflexota bacterium]MBT7290485.1 MFS transporter [Chloroflexota bacterium]